MSAKGSLVDLSKNGLIDSSLRPHLLAWVLLTLLVNAIPLFTPILNEGDSVLYAALSQHMVLSGNWNDLMLDGRDWLDKPHFPFWLGALSFKLIGVSVFAYMLPGYLCHLLGGYYTYRLARLFHGRDASLLALLVYVSTYHLMYTTTALKAEACPHMRKHSSMHHVPVSQRIQHCPASCTVKLRTEPWTALSLKTSMPLKTVPRSPCKCTLL